ncbi:transporter [Fulvitalea axinellae]|uniref:Transporter n=1 Tax=Fulvitalea axinellae TaxID=1182444 RepID=A0AAU9D2K7_9BACT|nr:transporter [Fulvitalea axinellae]
MNVKKRLLSFAAALSLGVFLGGSALAQDKMTLQQCVDYALKHHAEVQNADVDVRIAKAKVGETRAIGLPQINAQATWNNNLSLRKTQMPNVEGSPFYDPNAGEMLEFAFGTKFDGALGAELSQLLFDGSYIVGLQASSTYQELAKRQSVKTKIDRVDAVKRAYFLVLVNGKRKTLFDSNLERLEKLLNETDHMWKQGFAEKIDVDRIRVNYNNVKAQRDQFVRVHSLSQLALKFQMGYPLDGDLALVERLEDYDLTLPSGSQGNFDNRIEKQLLDVNIKLAKLNIRQYQVQYLPTLSFIGSVGYNTNADQTSEFFNFKQGWLDYSLVGLRVNVPIFDGLSKHYKIRQARMEKLKYEQQRKMLRQSFNVEYSQALNDLKTALDMLQVQEQNRELANEVFRVTKMKFQEGIGSNQELVDADNSLTEAQTNYFTALYDALVAKVALAKATGSLYGAP